MRHLVRTVSARFASTSVALLRSAPLTSAPLRFALLRFVANSDLFRPPIPTNNRRYAGTRYRRSARRQQLLVTRLPRPGLADAFAAFAELVAGIVAK